MCDEARLVFIRGVIEEALVDGPRPATRHQLERALRALRIEITAARNATDAAIAKAEHP